MCQIQGWHSAFKTLLWVKSPNGAMYAVAKKLYEKRIEPYEICDIVLSNITWQA